MTDPDGEALEAETAFQQRSLELQTEYTADLTAYCDSKVPKLLDNVEYAARCSALLISLTRQLGRAAAAMGEANNQDPSEVALVVIRMFGNSHARALEAIAGEGSTVQ